MMQPGRELDALVAEKVMGVKREHLYDKFTGKLLVSEHFGPPFYSTDIADAWTVVEKMISLGMSIQVSMQQNFQCCCLTIQKDGQVIGECADTTPHAICLAALKAVGVEEMS